jgi:eukaryotic-like serine/threonine-protein kinase
MSSPATAAPEELQVHLVGRYELHGVLASGGMATVHLGKMLGEVGFSRTVAIKRLHPQFATDMDFRSMLLEEARLASRIRHPNVVSVIDVVDSGAELLLVMEYVFGESLAGLLRSCGKTNEPVPPAIAVAIVVNLLDGLHAAHEARDESGLNLGVVHRDVSPQNVVVGADGVARVLDFGIAKAQNSALITREGEIKGKLAYMAPEQLQGVSTRITDVYAAGVVLWETLTSKRLFHGQNDGQTLMRIMAGHVEPVSGFGAPAELDAIVAKALARDPAERFESARAMSHALATALRPAAAHDVGEWVERLAAKSLLSRSVLVAQVESTKMTRTTLRGLGLATAEEPSKANSKAIAADFEVDVDALDYAAKTQTRGKALLAMGALTVAACLVAAIVTVRAVVASPTSQLAASASVTATAQAASWSSAVAIAPTAVSLASTLQSATVEKPVELVVVAVPSAAVTELPAAAAAAAAAAPRKTTTIAPAVSASAPSPVRTAPAEPAAALTARRPIL